MQKLIVILLFALSAVLQVACDPIEAASTKSPLTTACEVVNGANSINCAGFAH